jgi:hypothetical protein
MTISLDTLARLSKLLPRLAALTDRRRLEVLSDIDRVLAAHGITWLDIADALMSPNEIDAQTVLAMVERIRMSGCCLTFEAERFISEMVEKVEGRDAVHLSLRQIQWLYALDEKAAAETKTAGAAPTPARLVVASRKTPLYAAARDVKQGQAFRL